MKISEFRISSLHKILTNYTQQLFTTVRPPFYTHTESSVMEKPIRTNKPNIRTKCYSTATTTTRARRGGCNDIGGVLLVAVASLLVLQQQLTVAVVATVAASPASSAPSSASSAAAASLTTSLPSSSLPSTSSSVVRVLDIDPVREWIRLELPAAAATATTTAAAANADVIVVRPTTSSSACDTYAVKPLSIVRKSADGRELTVSYADVFLSADQPQAYLCVRGGAAGAAAQHLGAASRLAFSAEKKR